MKLIKLSEEHYIVVDDSEIKEGDYVIEDIGGVVYGPIDEDAIVENPRKITHSTNIDWHEVYYIPLSEVNELLGVVDVEKKAFELAILFHNTYEKLAPAFGYETRLDTKVFDKNSANGKLMIAVCKEIYQALEDNKERKYTEEDITEAILRTIDACNEAQKDSYGELEIDEEAIIQSLQPKTEWDVEFINGKLKLKQ